MNFTQFQELAAADALGALDHTDEAQLKAAMEKGAEAKSEIASFQDTAAALAQSAAAQPSPGLRARILESVRNGPQQKPDAQAPSPVVGFRFVLNDGSGWQATPLPGFRTKVLSVSQDTGYQVMLAELSPGARFPEHDHSSSEELFIISGHLQTEGRLLGPGDFLHAEPGTHHHELVSPDGCVAMIISRAPLAA